MTGCCPWDVGQWDVGQWDVGQAPRTSIFGNLRKNCATASYPKTHQRWISY